MSRSHYEYADEEWQTILWHGAVAKATKGARGQRMLMDLAAAMDAMPEKRLIKHELEADGQVCTLGCLGRARGIDMARLDPEDPKSVAKAFDVAPALVQEIAFENDEECAIKTPEERWVAMRQWVREQIKM